MKVREPRISMTPLAPPITYDAAIENEFLKATFNDGLLTAMQNKKDGFWIDVTQKFLYYTSQDYPGSGAYIFQPPNDDNATEPSWFNYTAIDLEIISDFEIRQHFHDANEATTVQRFLLDGNHLQITWTVGPLNADQSVCPEVVSRFETNLKTNGTMYTDSNGREMIKREKDTRPYPFDQENVVSGNYYPVTTAAFIRDEVENVQFTVLVDRPEGGTALVNDGDFELMLHRRTCNDDQLGANEALDETRDVSHTGPGLVVRGTHWISLERIETAAAVWRPKVDEMYQPLRPMFGVTPSAKKPTPQLKQGIQSDDSTFSSVSPIKTLPENMQVISFERHQCDESTFWNSAAKCKLLLRLAHQYGPGEHANFSKPTTVNMNTLFNFDAVPWKVVSGVETGLTGTENRTDMLAYRHQFNWQLDNGEGENVTVVKHISEPEWTWPKPATFGPLQVRTFVLDIE